jgi:2-isopropylmalate synthase
VQEVADRTGKELTGADIWALFEAMYLGRDGIMLAEYHLFPEPRSPERRRIAATIVIDGTARRIEGVGNGPIAAFVDALRAECGIALEVGDYREHALGAGADAQATAYVEIREGDAATLWGVGIDGNIVTASLKAVASAATRARVR